jgi:hypothetical protein
VAVAVVVARVESSKGFGIGFGIVIGALIMHVFEIMDLII